MSQHSNDPQKRACDELAALLVSEPGLRTLRLLTLTGAAVPQVAQAARGNAPEAAAGRGDSAFAPIGIWKPEVAGDEVRFVRAVGHPEDALWPRTPVLRPKKALLPLRICLLGESAAAGWVYAPELTPAMLLENELARASCAGRYEVVDLTRVDLSPDKLVEVAASCLQLDPDIVVVFAGNNWPMRSPRFPELTIEDAQEMARAVEEDGFAGFCRLRGRQTAALAGRVLRKLAEIFDDGSASVVLVVPEVELADWGRARPVAWLPGDGSARWYELHPKAHSLIPHGREGADSLVDVAEKMTSLDRGTCTASHRLASRARRMLGQFDEAEQAARGEIEARSYDNDPSLPGITSSLQEALREAAVAHDWECADLPEVFRATSLSDRRIFLDYCHLTAEGMRITAAGIAWHVLRLAEPDAAALSKTRAAFVDSNEPVLPEPEVEARAHFLTGLYHSHWSTSDVASEEAARHFRTALEASPALGRETLRSYLLSRAAPATALAVVDLPAMGAGGDHWTARFAYLANLDVSTCRAIVTVLRDVDETAADEYLARLLEVHDMGRYPADLLSPAYAMRPLDPIDQACGLTHERTAYHRAPWPTSEFVVVADGTRDIVVDWTARLAGTTSKAPLLEVSLNGHPLAEAALTTSWQKGTATLLRERLEKGINRLTLSWPALGNGDEALDAIVRRLGAGLHADLHPVFGELFSLAASPADR